MASTCSERGAILVCSIAPTSHLNLSKSGSPEPEKSKKASRRESHSQLQPSVGAEPGPSTQSFIDVPLTSSRCWPASPRPRYLLDSRRTDAEIQHNRVNMQGADISGLGSPPQGQLRSRGQHGYPPRSLHGGALYSSSGDRCWSAFLAESFPGHYDGKRPLAYNSWVAASHGS